MYHILFAMLLWSTLGLVIRLSGEAIHLLILYSCALSAALIGVLFLKRHMRDIPRGRTLYLLLAVAPISLVNTFSFFYAYRNTTIANAVLTHYTAPIVVALIAPVFLKERLTAKAGAAVAIATTGLWIMLGESPADFLQLLVSGDRNTAGIAGGLLSGLAYAVLIVVLRFVAQEVHPLVITFFQNGAIALLLLPFAEAPRSVVASIWAFCVMGLVHSTIAPMLYFRGMKTVNAHTAAILGYVEPLCAIALGVIFLGEAVSIATAIGGVLILISGYLTIKT
jgi:drug/metabolite transporter (DMT)-like permease